MAYVQRDYVLRLIERLARAIGRIVGLKRSGQLDEALQEVGEAADDILGPLRRTLELVDPQSAVKLLSDRDMIEAYARLTAEEASIHALRGDAPLARARALRALALLLEAQIQGHSLSGDATTVIAELRPQVDEAQLPECYRALLPA